MTTALPETKERYGSQENRLIVLRQQKRSLMQQLLTGKRRAKVAA